VLWNVIPSCIQSNKQYRNMIVYIFNSFTSFAHTATASTVSYNQWWQVGVRGNAARWPLGWVVLWPVILFSVHELLNLRQHFLFGNLLESCKTPNHNTGKVGNAINLTTYMYTALSFLSVSLITTFKWYHFWWAVVKVLHDWCITSRRSGIST